MTKVRLTRLLVAVIALIVVLTGCAGNWNRADLLGTWVHQASTGESAELQLAEDGTATISSVPRAVLFPTAGGLADVDWSDTVSGSGSWGLDQGGDIVLSIVDDGGEVIGPKLFVGGSAEVEIYAFVGPAESAVFRFERDPGD